MQSAVAGLVALACAVALRRDIAWGLDRTELRAMLAFSLPLVPAGVAVFATVYLHRYVLGALGTLDDVGLFGIASRVAALATLVLIGVQGALTPLVYAHHAEPGTPARLARLLEAFWAFALLACLALAAFGRELLALLATPSYAGAAPLVLWLAPAALLAQMYIFAPGIPLAKKTGWQLALTVVSGTLGLLLALVLVPRWQAQGAALAAWVASAVFFGAWLAAGQRLYPLPLRWGSLALATATFVALAAAVSWHDRAAAGESTSQGLIGTALVLRLAALAVLALACRQSGLLRRSPAGAPLPPAAGAASER
jgi:O-antigen/teichoic acid export membrane protein